MDTHDPGVDSSGSTSSESESNKLGDRNQNDDTQESRSCDEPQVSRTSDGQSLEADEVKNDCKIDRKISDEPQVSRTSGGESPGEMNDCDIDTKNSEAHADTTPNLRTDQLQHAEKDEPHVSRTFGGESAEADELKNDCKIDPKNSEAHDDTTPNLRKDQLQHAEKERKTMDIISGNKFVVLLSGNTLNSHEKVRQHIQQQRPHLEEVDKVDDCDFLLFFCPVVSRAGTDIEVALKRLHTAGGNKPAVLVVLHHTIDPDRVVPNSSRSVTRQETLTVDCLFHEDHGFLQCPQNDQSLATILKVIEFQTSTNYFWGCCESC